MATSEGELLTKVIAGDTAALGELLERYGPQVRGELSIDRKWQSLLSADDVMQVTYLEAFLQISRFSPCGEGSFRAWLRRIAENNLRDAIRELQRAKRPQPQKRVTAPSGDDSFVALFDLLAGTTSTPSRRAARREIADMLEAAIRELPDDYQTVVRRCDLESDSASEVASAMGRSTGAVYMLRARAHERLREALGSESKFFSDRA